MKHWYRMSYHEHSRRAKKNFFAAYRERISRMGKVMIILVGQLAFALSSNTALASGNSSLVT